MATIPELEAEVARLKELVLDRDDSLQRLEAQHDVLENFVFGLEREHDKARKTIEATQGELQASYDRLRALKEGQDDILANVRQGILTINPDGTINAEFSRIATRMFERDDLAGLSFYALFQADPAVQGRLRRYLELSFTAPHAGAGVLERLNPVADYEYVVTGRDGRAITKLFSFSFARMTRAAGGGATAISKIMVVVDDRTVEYELNRELARRTREQAVKVEKAYHILTLPPDVVRDFMGEAKATVTKLEAELGQAAADGAPRQAETVRCLRLVHTLKGNARALNLDLLSAAAHALETALADGAPREPKRVNDALAALREEVEDGEQMFDKLLGMRTAVKTSWQDRAKELETTLRNLVEAEAKAAGKVVELAYELELPEGIPPHWMFRIKSAFVQLVRNAIAHGIELPDVRRASGKREVGVLRIRACIDGDAIVMSCRDDGAGLSPDALRAAAIQRGLLQESAARALTDADALALVFTPGLSTAPLVSESSGRGIGMEVVRESTEALGGRVRVESSRGVHTEFSMVIPRAHSERPFALRRGAASVKGAMA